MAISVVITLDAVDISASVPGVIRVLGREGIARVAVFSFNPSVGSIDSDDYIGKAITIDYVDGGADRLFTGIVNTPNFNTTTGLLTLGCTDNLQESVELITRAAIDALLPGSWHEAVFNDPSENWTYAQQIMNTYPGSFDKDSTGATRVTDWQAKAIPDFTYTNATILHNTLSFSMIERRNIINSIKISFSSRYQRQWQREVLGAWNLGVVWADFLANPTPLPTKEMVAHATSGWTAKSITYTDLPDSGTYGGIVWVLNEYAQSQCQGAIMTLARRWVQNTTDNYTITIAAAASVSKYGVLKVGQRHTVTAEPDSEFMNFDDYSAPTGVLIEAGNYLNLDDDDPTAAIETAMNLAKTTILSKHRAIGPVFDVLLNPAIDVDKTVRVNHTKGQATGKVYAFEHVIDLSAGSNKKVLAKTICTLAVYLPNVTSQVDDTLTAPASPHVDPSGLTNALPALTNHFGNVDGAPVDDPDWNGWITNYVLWTGTPPPPELYDTRFSFEIPAVTETDAAEFNGSSSFNIAIPQDELVIIK